MVSSKHFIRKSVIATLSVAIITGLAPFASSAAWAAKPFPLPPMLHFTPIAPNTPTIQVKPMAPWHANQLLDPDSPGGPAWGGLFDVEALGMSQNNPTSPEPGCDYWPSRAQSIAWWEAQPANKALSNLQVYTYGTPQHFQWIIGTEYSHQDAMGWQYRACPPPPPPSSPSIPGGTFTTVYGYTWNAKTGTYTTPNGSTAPTTTTYGTINGKQVTIYTATLNGVSTSQIVYNNSGGGTTISSVMGSGSQLLQNGNGTVAADMAVAGVGGGAFANYQVNGSKLQAAATTGGGSCTVNNTSAACNNGSANAITGGGSFSSGTGTTATGSKSSVRALLSASGFVGPG